MPIARINLIPRYNWDFGLRDFKLGMSSIFREDRNNFEVIRRLFGQDPVLTSSGRTSLYLILKALNLPKGAEIGVPLYCCPVVFDAIRKAGLKLRFIDIDPCSYTISPEDLERKSKSLGAVVAVHMFGHPADMDAILDVSAGKFPVIEDCAQSLFSKYKETMTGFLSKAAFFSFRSAKYISAGEGSLIVSSDPELMEVLRRAATILKKPQLAEEFLHCSTTLAKSILNKKPWFGLIGFPIGRMLDNKINLTAKWGFEYKSIRRSDLSIITKKIQTFSEKIEKQRKNAFYLLDNIRSGGMVLPFEKKGYRSNYYLFALRLSNKSKRDALSEYLLKNGIDTSKYLHEVVSIASTTFGYQGDCPTSEKCSETVLVVPHHYSLKQSELDYLVEQINASSQVLN